MNPRDVLRKAFAEGALYRWVWYWKGIDRELTCTCESNGIYEARQYAQANSCIGLGYQYTSADGEPVKVTLVYPKRWLVAFTLHKLDDGYWLYKRFNGRETAIERLTGQFPKALLNVKASTVKVGCVE